MDVCMTLSDSERAMKGVPGGMISER